jgi:hypothetical protein
MATLAVGCGQAHGLSAHLRVDKLQVQQAALPEVDFLHATQSPPKSIGNADRRTVESVLGALHCTALHCTALHCTALHCTAHLNPQRL